jgi:predicted TIM-barrel fold metal-dependent hydrolase
MIVDFRTRPPFKSWKKLRIWGERPKNPDPVTASGLLQNIEPYRSYEEKSMDAFMEEMDEAEIDVAVVMGRQAPDFHGNVPAEEVAELVDTYPGRFVGFGGVSGTDLDAGLKEIDRCVEFGFKGVAFDNGWCDPPMYDDDERLFPLYEKCQELGLIASITSSIYVGPDISYSMPVHIHRVAQRFQDLTIVVPHAGFPWGEMMCGIAFHRPNIYLIPDIYLNVPNLPGAGAFVRSANSFLSYRLLYASSYPVRPLGQSLRSFRGLPFDTDEIRDRCSGGNGARLLGIEKA